MRLVAHASRLVRRVAYGLLLLEIRHLILGFQQLSESSDNGRLRLTNRRQ